MYKKRNYARKARKSIPRKTYRKKVSRKKNTLVKTILKTIHRNVENKVYTNYAANNSIATCTGGAVPYQLSLLPNISQGASVTQRNGNSCRIMKSQFNYRVNLLPYNAITNSGAPIHLKMYVVSLKNKSQFAGAPTVADYANFFQAGSTTLNFQGNVLDTLFRINSELFTIHTTRTHTLAVASGSQAIGINSNSGAANPYASGVIYLEKYAKMIKFNDATTDVTNRSLWLVCQAVEMNGGTGTGVISCELHYNHEIQYEDA